ncbi:ABC transporter permease [Chelatococcus asaccharovorans]|uniref:Putative spermidine/putrescine transport system permease protein n=1 Tax=Chelatococcus asaccharovorans TaxID=28210 RepID=A0A2V3TU42_9HYPH|nr:ABC transporter permease [Chelatococcus asaccharovorans]MBS7702054.1 ABC transporter permease [Chelatococcus asaccharovorans]PXW52824.1 putative spermidine/putrescine transport system permease protein [Chelatococcus asaccharovorans]CAH1667501.1 putative spermidine/putrescine transport system permease protein [Chelatococcus asaccharovorans]CAH1680895.1 putative spermidine/putrescine transport system permease protein [Chelatococcus asaccharovorans]
MRKPAHPLLRGYVWVMMVFMALPLVVVIGASFNRGAAIRFPPEGMTLHWYAEVWRNADMVRSATNSLLLAVCATLISFIIGVPAALALVRHVHRHREALQAFLLSPMTVPAIVLGIAFLVFFGWTGMGLSFTTLLIAHVIITVPYVIRSVAGVYLGVAVSIEEAAKVLGADPWQLFTKVTLPLIMPGVVAGGLFSFIMSFDNVPVSIFLTRRETLTLPVYVMSYLVHNFDPTIAAVSSVQVLFTTAAIIVIEKFYGIRRLTETI